MAVDLNVSVAEFLEACAARQPVPGGGAASALAGAMAASMGEMVLQYSVGKKGLEEFQSELKPALEKMRQARLHLQHMAVEDQQAFEAVTALRKLPADHADRQKLPEAILTSAKVPQNIANAGVTVLELCDQMVNFVNPYLLSDLAVAADLAMAATRCAVYNVRVNLPDIADEATRMRIEASMTDVLMRASKVIQQVTPRIWARWEMEK